MAAAEAQAAALATAGGRRTVEAGQERRGGGEEGRRAGERRKHTSRMGTKREKIKRENERIREASCLEGPKRKGGTAANPNEDAATAGEA